MNQKLDEKTGEVVIGTEYIKFLVNPYHDPTWEDIQEAVDQSIEVTGNSHIYLEQLEEIRKEKLPESLKTTDIPLYFISMGN